MELSVRALNCLKAASMGHLLTWMPSENDLMKFRNFGKKSLNEIDMLMDD